MPALSATGTLPSTTHIVLVGMGATALMDLWLLLLARLGLPGASFGMVGRWVGHFVHGRFAHAAIAKAEPIPFEHALGWLTHYLIGVAYAALLVALLGAAWLERPTALAPLVFGALTVLAPWFVMQPAMGAGFLASKTAAPTQNALKSLVNHLVFGGGLYLAAAALAGWAA